MWLALLIGLIWAVDGLLFWVAGKQELALLGGVLAILPTVLTIYQRHLAAAEAARVYLAAQRARGISEREASARVHELAPDGVVFETKDVASWPTYLIMLLALGAMVALGSAALDIIF